MPSYNFNVLQGFSHKIFRYFIRLIEALNPPPGMGKYDAITYANYDA